MSKLYAVYKHTSPNGKIYIGITLRKPIYRWNNGKGYLKQVYFYNAILKYGWENIKHEILFENLTKEEAEQKEIELIRFYKSNQRAYGYNIANGGRTRGSVSEETKLKLSEMYKGKPSNRKGCKLSKETKEKISRNTRGKKLTEETKQRIGIASKNRERTEEWKHNISNGLKGKKLSEEHKKKISEAHKDISPINKGVPMKEEQKEKISKANLGKIRTEEMKKKISENHARKRCIIQYTLNDQYLNEFNSIVEAAKSLNTSASAIYACCSNMRKTHKGYKWKYKES